MENARLLTETREALEQQTATAEVLQVINSSPGELAPVFDAMLEKGVRLCEASFGLLCTFDGERLQIAAMRGVPAPYAEFLTGELLPFAPGSGPASILAGARFHTVTDFAADPLTLSGDPHRRALVELGGARSGAAVPLRKDATLVGMFLVFRPEVQPFTEKQLALLEKFAAQAVIAMENARLLTETREALDQQTGTAEVLQLINSWRGVLVPVFDATLERASRLSESALGFIATYDGEHFHMAAGRGLPPAFAELASTPYRPPPGAPSQRLIDGESFVQIADLREDEGTPRGLSPVHQALVEAAGGRSFLTVPLRRQGVLVGVIVIYRREVRPFSDKQIALLQNFAAQAVIAMENARLLTETREALEQQTATAEVLEVINASPGNLAPVFEAVLDKATRLCDFAFSILWTYDGQAFRAVAMHGVPTQYATYLTGHTIVPPPNTEGAFWQFIAGRDFIH